MAAAVEAAAAAAEEEEGDSGKASGAGADVARVSVGVVWAVAVAVGGLAKGLEYSPVVGVCVFVFAAVVHTAASKEATTTE